MHKKLVNKKVEIIIKIVGTNKEEKVTGVVVDTHFDGTCAYIELDSGLFINMLYVVSVKLL